MAHQKGCAETEIQQSGYGPHRAEQSVVAGQCHIAVAKRRVGHQREVQRIRHRRDCPHHENSHRQGPDLNGVRKDDGGERGCDERELMAHRHRVDGAMPFEHRHKLG